MKLVDSLPGTSWFKSLKRGSNSLQLWAKKGSTLDFFLKYRKKSVCVCVGGCVGGGLNFIFYYSTLKKYVCGGDGGLKFNMFGWGQWDGSGAGSALWNIACNWLASHFISDLIQRHKAGLAAGETAICPTAYIHTRGYVHYTFHKCSISGTSANIITMLNTNYCQHDLMWYFSRPITHIFSLKFILIVEGILWFNWNQYLTSR